MRSLRLLIACAILRGAGAIAAIVAGELSQGCGHHGHTSKVPSWQHLRPIERMLLGSIVGLGIAVIWLWICARAGR